jgi:hypothetical protein
MCIRDVFLSDFHVLCGGFGLFELVLCVSEELESTSTRRLGSQNSFQELRRVFAQKRTSFAGTGAGWRAGFLARGVEWLHSAG